jgi:hypothetical protein
VSSSIAHCYIPATTDHRSCVHCAADCHPREIPACTSHTTLPYHPLLLLGGQTDLEVEEIRMVAMPLALEAMLQAQAQCPPTQCLCPVGPIIIRIARHGRIHVHACRQKDKSLCCPCHDVHPPTTTTTRTHTALCSGTTTDWMGTQTQPCDLPPPRPLRFAAACSSTVSQTTVPWHLHCRVRDRYRTHQGGQEGHAEGRVSSSARLVSFSGGAEGGIGDTHDAICQWRRGEAHYGLC